MIDITSRQNAGTSFLLILEMEQNSTEIISLFPEVHLDRPSLTIEGRRSHCLYGPKPKPGIKEQLKKKARDTFSCSREKLYKILVARLPIIGWLFSYNVKEWLVGDIVAGTTVAILHIPQGMGFALLAYIPAICGLYMAFYQVLIYAFFGTSRQMAMGSFAVITLMTGKVVKEHATFPENGDFAATSDGLNATLDALSAEGIYTPIQVATITTFMVGIWLLLFGVLQLGSLCVFLSDMLVSGFTTAATIHILTSQLKDMLGIKIPGHSGPLKLIYTYIDIFTSIPSANIATIIITIIALIVLIINNEILKPIVSKYSRVPIPIELICVVTGTLASYYGQLTENYQVNIVGDIPTGFPPATLPPMDLIGKVAFDSLVIAIVSYTIDISMAKLFARKYDYSIDATQELYAHGFTNLGSSFFACPPTGGALARVIIQDGAGGKTQLASLICAFLIIFVLLFIGPLFETLPRTVLACIIVSALKGMFMQVKDMLAMWPVSRLDAVIWIVTFSSTVIIDIDFGLLIGVLFSLFILLFRNQKPTIERLGRLPDSDFYLNIKDYPEAKEYRGLCLLRIIGPIHFANRESLKQSMISLTDLNLQELAKNRKNPTVRFNREMEKPDQEYIGKAAWVTLGSGLTDVEGCWYLVLDMSGISYIDNSGSKFIETIRGEYEKAGITLCLAGLPDLVLNVMQKSDSLKNFKKYHLFHSLHDSVSVLSDPKLFKMIFFST